MPVMLHSLTLLTQSRRREGLTNFPWQSLSASAYRALVALRRTSVLLLEVFFSRFTWSPFNPPYSDRQHSRSSLCHAQHTGDVCTRLSATCQPGAALQLRSLPSAISPVHTPSQFLGGSAISC